MDGWRSLELRLLLAAHPAWAARGKLLGMHVHELVKVDLPIACKSMCMGECV